MPKILTHFEIMPHPFRGTEDANSERTVILSAEIRAAQGASAEHPILEITSTSEGEDRHGSRIFEWDTRTHMRTGQVLWQHDACPWLPQVAKKLGERKVGNRTVSTHELLIPLWRHIEQAYGNLPAFLWEAALVHEMGTISRSFIPLEWTARNAETIPRALAENIDYLKVEQTEESYVNVQSNRESVFARAIARARSAGSFTDGLAKTLGYEISPIIIRSQSMNRAQIVFGERGIRAAGPFDFASTQVNLDGDDKEKVLAIAAAIPDDVIAEKGRETDPHITVKFGIAPDVKVETIIEALANSDSVREMVMKGGAEMTLGATAIFESESGSHADGADVVYIAVDSPDLVLLNKIISEAVPVTDTHPEYVPHITLAYVKKGEGAKFAGDETLKGTVVTFVAIGYSDTEGNLTEIPLAEASASRAAGVKIRTAMQSFLRCCGCDVYRPESEPIHPDAVEVEVALMRGLVESLTGLFDSAIKAWKATAQPDLRGTLSSIAVSAIYNIESLLYRAHEWYDVDLGFPWDESMEAVDTERFARDFTAASRAGAVFSAKNLGKIDQVIDIMGELRAAATKPTADDVPADDDAARSLKIVDGDIIFFCNRASCYGKSGCTCTDYEARVLRARTRAAGDASSVLAEIGDTITAITEAVDDAPDGAMSAAVEGLAALLLDIEDVLTDVAAIAEEANPSPDDTSARATRAAARRLMVNNLVRRARAMDAGDGSMADLVAAVTESLALLTEAVAKVPEASQVDVAAAIDALLESAKKILADLTTPAEARTFIRIKSGVAPHEQGAKSHIRVLVPDALGDRPEESPTPRRSTRVSLLSD